MPFVFNQKQLNVKSFILFSFFFFCLQIEKFSLMTRTKKNNNNKLIPLGICFQLYIMCFIFTAYFLVMAGMEKKPTKV
jgi:magnesium-transporting ATPase (P-type)